eukprot:GHRR01025105.1.p1 GENE.GHRR01025105.1~~GHRR01025105.1.p1  ORF type:complete len:171 (-),score=29.18 GHRR01025105.1:323-835(-)
MVWVWADNPLSTWAAARAQPPSTAAREVLKQGYIIKSSWFQRDVPLSMDTLFENFLDPSLVPFSHDGVLVSSCCSKNHIGSLDVLQHWGKQNMADQLPCCGCMTTCFGVAYPCTSGGHVPTPQVAYVMQPPGEQNTEVQQYMCNLQASAMKLHCNHKTFSDSDPFDSLGA